jgi:hypothetical protein
MLFVLSCCCSFVLFFFYYFDLTQARNVFILSTARLQRPPLSDLHPTKTGTCIQSSRLLSTRRDLILQTVVSCTPILGLSP